MARARTTIKKAVNPALDMPVYSQSQAITLYVNSVLTEMAARGPYPKQR